MTLSPSPATPPRLSPPAPAGTPRPRPSEVLSAGLDRDRRTRELVEQLIAEPSRLGPDFTPIRRIGTGAPSALPLVGWKATGRGDAGSSLATTLQLLHEAASLGLVERLDWAFRCHAFDVALDSGMVGELHITPEPETFGTACPPRLAVSWLRGRRALDICAELHEDAFDDRDRLLAAADEMAGWGWHLVVADVSGTPAQSAAELLMPRLRPAYVQVDLSRLRRDDAASRRLLDAGREAGATVLAVGVTTQADLEAADALGALHVRGPLVGHASSRPV